MQFMSNVGQQTLGLAMILLMFVWSSSACDHKWIRMVYMKSCGMKKRHIADEALEGDRPISPKFDHLQPWNNFTDMNLEDFQARPVPDLKNTQIPFKSDGTPSLWMLQDLLSEDDDEIIRRQLGNLIDKCCQVPPTSTCSAKDFVGACK